MTIRSRWAPTEALTERQGPQKSGASFAELAPQVVAWHSYSNGWVKRAIELMSACSVCFFSGWCLVGSVRARDLIHLTSGILLRDSVAFLDLADQLIALPGDHLQVVVGQPSPLFFGLAPGLFPFSFDLIPIHGTSSVLGF